MLKDRTLDLPSLLSQVSASAEINLFHRMKLILFIFRRIVPE